MKRISSMLALYGIAAYIMGGDLDNSRERYVEPKETEEERKKRLLNAEIERKKSQGLKEFFYGENSLWALNQKSAYKKALKYNWIRKESK